ncbi:endothelin-converting enzyme 1-like [Haemaphysalis longicornis]
MGHAAAALLAPPVGSQARSAVRDAVATATDQLKRQLVGYLWMSEAVSQRAVHKLNALQAHLFYPAFVEDKMVLEQIYRQVPDTLGQQPALLEWFRARSAVMLKRWKALAGKGLPPLWDLPYLEPTVHYLPDSNELVVPVGILRDPIYSPPGNALPLDAARFGFRLARQLAQVALYRGAFHDESGALHFWWERSSFVRLQRAENCLVRHHAADPVEALLDQVALQAAYAVSTIQTHTQQAALRHGKMPRLLFTMTHSRSHTTDSFGA